MKPILFKFMFLFDLQMFIVTIVDRKTLFFMKDFIIYLFDKMNVVKDTKYFIILFFPKIVVLRDFSYYYTL